MRCTSGLAQVGLATEPRQFRRDLAKVTAGFLPELHVRGPSTNGEIAAIAADKSNTPGNALQTCPKLEVRPSTGRGVGLFALERISMYTIILEDEALLSLAHGEDLPELWEKYYTLPPELKNSFEELSFPAHLAAREDTLIAKLEQRGYASEEARSMARVNSRWQANAFKTGASSSVAVNGNHQWAYALFRTIARTNHSCVPNAHPHYRPSTGVQQVYALRDIEKDEEIEIGYFDVTMALSDRQTRAKSWGFQCSCKACSGNSNSLGAEYEQRLSYVHQHLVSFDKLVQPGTMVDSTQTAISIAHSPDYPWLVLSLPTLYHNLAELEKRLQGRREKVKDALEKALEWEMKITGSNSASSEERRADFVAFAARTD